MADYVPCKGDLIALTCDPPAGKAQQGRRPALVVSNDLFNERTGLCLTCPITSTNWGYPSHVVVLPAEGGDRFAMVEQVESIDFRTRKAIRIGKASPGMLDEVLSLLETCIY